VFILLATTVCTLRKCLHVADTFFVVLVLVLQHELFSLFWLLLGVLQGTQKYPNPRLFPFSYPLAVCFGFVYFFFSSYSLPALARKTGFELSSVAPVVPHLLLLLFCVLLLSVPHVENENLYDPHKYQHRDIGFVFGPRFERLVLQI